MITLNLFLLLIFHILRFSMSPCNFMTTNYFSGKEMVYRSSDSIDLTDVDPIKILESVEFLNSIKISVCLNTSLN